MPSEGLFGGAWTNGQQLRMSRVVPQIFDYADSGVSQTIGLQVSSNVESKVKSDGVLGKSLVQQQ